MRVRNVKRMIASLMLATMVLGQASTVSAAGGVAFNMKKWTTTARDENLQRVVGKVKADNEQRWYITLTQVDGLGTEKSNPHGNAIAVSEAPKGCGAPLALFKSYKNKTKSQSYYKGSGAAKNKTCYLKIGGNSNNTKKYTIKLAGRYCS